METKKTAIIIISIAAVGGLLIAGCCGVVGLVYWTVTQPQKLPYAEGDDLASARQNFQTKLIQVGPAPQEYENETPPTGVKQVEYTSDQLQLKAWILDDPGDGKKRPAVVYLHGGWAFGGMDWDDAKPFVDDGFVLMMPMLRAENGNPGYFENQYGEVDDAVAAGEYVASLPYVDANNIFVAGHSAGGVLTTLVAMVPSNYKAAAALSGSVDYESFVDSGWGASMPYNRFNGEERRLRNPMAFVGSLRLPIYLFAEQSNPHMRLVNQRFATRAKELGKSCEFSSVHGDHMSMVAPAVQQTIPLFRKHITSK